MKKQTIDTNQIIEKTIHLVAVNGLENLSTKKVSVECKISEGSIFNYFPTKNDLLVKSLYYIDGQIDDELRSVKMNLLSIKKTIRDLWMTYFDFFLKNPDYARFYRQFRHSSYYTYEVIDGQNQSLSRFVAMVGKLSEKYKGNLDIFWVFVIETTLNFAVRVVDGQLPNEEKDCEKYFNMLANGMNSVFKNTKDWQ